MNTATATRSSRIAWLRPFDWSWIELAFMRLTFAALAVWMVDGWWNVGRLSMWDNQPHPVGLARFMDLTWLAHHAAAIQPVAFWVIAVALVFYVVGFLSGPAMLPFGVFTVMAGALMNSQGATNHATQLVTMCGLAQLAAYFWPAPKAEGWGSWLVPGLQRQRRAIHWASITLAAGYVVCGAIKLVRSDFMWFSDAQNLSVQLMKTHWAQYFDRGVPVSALFTEKVPQFLIAHPIISGVFFGIGLALELFAFLALRSRAWAFFFGVTLVALHVIIGQLFGLHFWTHEAILTILWINIPGLPKLARALFRRRVQPAQDSVQAGATALP